MAESWEEFPDVETTQPAPQVQSWEELPDLPEAEQPGPIAPSVTGFTADELDTQKAEQQKADDLRLLHAFDAADQVGPKAARAYAVSKELGAKYTDVLLNLEGFESAARLAKRDPAKFRRDNPVLMKMLDRRPELADVALSDKEIALTVQAWNKAVAWNQRPVEEASAEELRTLNEQLAQQANERNQPVYPAGGPEAPLATPDALPVADPLEAERNRPLQPAPAPDAPKKTPEELAAAQKAFDEEQVRLNAPVKTQELNDAKAKAGREFGFPLVPVLRAKEALAQQDVAKAQISWMLAEVEKGENSAEALDARGKMEDLKLEATPRAYGDDSGLSRQLTIGITGGLSTAEMIEGSVKGAGVSGIAAGTITGLGALIVTKSPAAALRSFVAGAEVVAGKGAQVGAAWASFNMELGPTYENNRQLKTERGQFLTPREAFGAAVIEAGLKAGLESLSFGVQTKALAGGLTAMRERLRGQLLTDATLRKKVMEFGIEWVKGGASEFGTGGLQSMVEQIGDYLATSGKDAALQFDKGVPLTEVKFEQKDRPFVDARKTLTDAEAEGMGALLFGAFAGSASLAMTATAADRQAHLNQQVPALLAMAQTETFQVAPDAFAETVRETTAESGNAVDSLHVDGEAVMRFFQENEPDDPNAANKALTELLGPEAAAKAEAAAANKTKLEIPLERAPAWAASEIGKALVDATTLDPESLSARELAERATEIKAEAKRIADEAKSTAKEEAEIDAAMPNAEKELVATGRVTKQGARDVAQIWKSFSTNMARDFGIPASALFQKLKVRFLRGDDGQLSMEDVVPARIEQPTAPEDLVNFERNLTDDERRQALYIDDVTGLHSRRAFDERIVTPGTGVGVIAIPDVKAINDHSKGGHDVTNRLLRLFGSKLGAVTEGRQSARSGTDFLVEVTDQAQLDGIVKELQAVAPEGVRVLGFFGKDVAAAGGAEKEGTKALRALPESDPNFLLPRGKTAFARETLTDESFPAAPAKRTVPEHLAKKEPLRGKEFVQQILTSPKAPGLRSRAGFIAAGEKRFSASVDMRGLKNINALMEEIYLAQHLQPGMTPEQADAARARARAEAMAKGDEVMVKFAEAALGAGANDVFFAHMSGDEFAAKADSKADLDRFVALLRVGLQRVGVSVTLTDGTKAKLRPNFRSGVAEGSYGKADQQLNRDKSLEQPEPEGLSARDSLRRAGVLVEEEPAGDRGGGGSDGGPGDPGVLGGGREDRAGVSDREGAGAQGTDALGAASESDGRGTAPGDEGLPLGGREVRARGDGGVDGAEDGELDRLIADTLAEREARGPLRQEEAEALEAHYNLPESVEKARASIARLRQSTVKAVAGETKKKHKERVAEAKKELLRRRAAAEAFVSWVENTGKGIVDEGMAYKREGALGVSAELLKETLAWAYKQKLIDPENGFSAMLEREMRKMNGPNDYRGPKKKKMAQPVELAKHNATGNNDTLVKMLKQENETAGGAKPERKKPPRGYTEMPSPSQLEKVYNVFFNKRADPSTAIHESGHVFLEMMGELVSRADAPTRLKETYAAALKWLTVSDRSELTIIQPARGQSLTEEQKEHNDRARAAHEKFARGFEVYLYEGKAPNAALNKVFTRFKWWLTKIYRSITSLKVELNDDIRRVFDRMLAADDELQKHLSEEGPPLFTTAEEAGMTDEEFAEYQDDLREAHEHAKRKAELHLMRERLVETEAAWQRELAEVTKKAGEDYERLQARTAQRILGGIAIGDFDAEPVALDKKAVEQLVGKEQAKKLNTTTENGTHPDEVAEFAGYPTGGAMLAAVLTLPAKETWVKREAEARMKEAHPSLLDERAKLQKMVAEGMHGVTEKRLLEERAALRSRGPKGSTKPAPIEALKEAAKLMVEQTELGKLQPHLALAAERKAANDVVRFAARGDTRQALEANTRQLLNAAVYREAMKAAGERDGLFDLAGDLSKKAARARHGKASPAFRDAIDFLLSVTQLNGTAISPSAQEWAAGLQAINDAVALMEAEEVGVGAWHDSVAELLAKGNWRKLTVKDMRTLRDALDNLRAAATQRNTALVDDKKVDREEVVAELVREIGEHRAKERTPGTSSSDVVADRLGKAWNAFDSFLSNPQDTFRELSNDNQDSMLFKALVLPFQRAKHREADLLKSTIKPILDTFDRMPKSMRERGTEKVDGAKLFPGHTKEFLPPRERHELWMLALNYGNESNAQRVRDGRKVSHSEVLNALDMLTKEELEVIQAIGDAHEKLRPEAFDLEEQDSGLAPEAIKARPLQLKNGTLRGFYFPVAYESVSQLGKQQEGSLAAGIMDPSYGRGATPRGHLKARANEVHDNIVSLDPRRIFQNYAQVAHDIAFRLPVRSINALLTNTQVVAALQERVGLERTQEAQQWTKDVAQMRAAEMSDGWSRAQRWIRGNMAPALLGYYLPNAVGDLANLGAAVASTPLKAKHLAAGMSEFFKAGREAALAKSGELRFMQDELTREFQKQVKTLSRNQVQRGFSKLKDNAFVFMEAVNVATATPVWIGAYRQALAEGKSEQQAIDFGDDIVRRVFPSHSAVDQAAILRDKKFWGTMTVFYGYLSVAARATRTLANPLFTQEFRDASAGGKAATAAGVGMRMLGFFFAFQVVGEFLMGRGPEDGDYDPDDEKKSKARQWANWTKRKMLMAPVSLVPIPGFASGIESKLLGKRPNQKGDPLGSYIMALGELAVDGLQGNLEPGDAAARAAKLAGLTFGAPVRPLSTTGAYVRDVATGERQSRGPISAAAGVVYGERENQPANPLSVAAQLFGEK